MKVDPHEMRWISDADAVKLRALPHFGESRDSRYDLNKLLGFYILHFVEQIFKFERDVKIRTIADIGTGYGWLAIAFALRASVRIVAVDPNEPRLVAARQIAEILGVCDRIEWRVGSLGNLPLDDQEIDATYCIEVIEHTGDRVDIIRDLARVTKELLVITSPNKLFPLIHHDTRLPFCHWLPPGILRDGYAAAFGRRGRQRNNRFWSPQKLLSALPDFEKESAFLQFQRYEDYLRAERRLLAENGQHETSLEFLKGGYYRAASWMGKGSIYVLPNLAATFRRKASSRLPDGGGSGRASDPPSDLPAA
jgi:SAM-dependent methyltransferase